MTDQSYDFAAVTIGVFLLMLRERYSENEVLRMLEPQRVRAMMEALEHD